MDAKLRLVKNLFTKKSARKKEKKFVVEGPHLAAEAVDWIDFVIYAKDQPLLEQLQKKNISCFKVTQKEYDELSAVETPQGILAVIREQSFGLNAVIKADTPLIVFCINVQDPGNLGTIIRTADAVGASGVILSKGTVDLYNPKVIRSTMGSLFHLPIVQEAEVEAAVAFLKQHKIKLIAADLAGEKSHFALKYNQPMAVLVGNEAAGLPPEIVQLCDEKVKIPMPGKAESLNVGVSAAVILYEALRQRMNG
ncbi:MAG: RNA methyltransferase [Candidatus Margulisbacteria bacterium]|nr:RNA methyltransferase [Candidatus Margulisiibacteriota bacterium]